MDRESKTFIHVRPSYVKTMLLGLLLLCPPFKTLAVWKLSPLAVSGELLAGSVRNAGQMSHFDKSDPCWPSRKCSHSFLFFFLLPSFPLYKGQLTRLSASRVAGGALNVKASQSFKRPLAGRAGGRHVLSPCCNPGGISWVNHGMKLKTIIDLCIC